MAAIEWGRRQYEDYKTGVLEALPGADEVVHS